MPYDVFTKLYDSMVWPVIAFGTAVWVDKTYSCTNAVQNRATRYILDKYSSNAAVAEDMGWSQPTSRQWKSVLLQWHRFVTMSNARLDACIS